MSLIPLSPSLTTPYLLGTLLTREDLLYLLLPIYLPLGTYLLNAERTIRSNPATCRSQTKRDSQFLYHILHAAEALPKFGWRAFTFSGSPFFGALAARAQGGILFRFVKSPSLMPVPQLPRGHATRLEAVKGRQTKNQTCEWTEETQPQTKSKKSSYFIFPYPFAPQGLVPCL